MYFFSFKTRQKCYVNAIVSHHQFQFLFCSVFLFCLGNVFPVGRKEREPIVCCEQIKKTKRQKREECPVSDDDNHLGLDFYVVSRTAPVSVLVSHSDSFAGGPPLF